MKVSLKQQQGFTIIELLIVIVVIGILAALVLNQFGNIQQQARDTERQSDINAIHTQLELYHAKNSAYPAALADLPELNPEATDPPTAGETYTFTVTQDDGVTACTTAAGDCAQYTLSATMETDINDDGTVDSGDVFERNSLN